MPKIALDDVCTTLLRRARRERDEQHVPGAGDVDRVEQRAVLRQRDLRDVVEHDVDAVARGTHRVAVADVAAHELEGLAASAPGGFRSKMRTESPQLDRTRREQLNRSSRCRR